MSIFFLVFSSPTTLFRSFLHKRLFVHFFFLEYKNKKIVAFLDTSTNALPYTKDSQIHRKRHAFWSPFLKKNFGR